MAELLIELFSEEIPARMQLGAARDFERLFGAKLTASGLSFAAIRAYVGPRRLALVVDSLPLETAAVSEEVKGPREGAPPQALEGFLRKVGLTQDQLVVEGGVYLARIEKPGVKTADVLGDMLREVILSFPWPKSMRSGTSTFRWVRPLKRILFLFDGAVVPFELEGLSASNVTEGHRFLGSGQPLAVANFASYKKALADNSVILDHGDRQAIILEQARQVCAGAGCELMDDQGLLEEVAGLNEFPVPLLGDMDPSFLTLPPEVIKTSMRTHQKYFAVGKTEVLSNFKGWGDVPGAEDEMYLEPDGSLLRLTNKFVITANTRASDGGTEIKRGNAKVLSARLSDGLFFWNEDKKAGNFEVWLKRLEGTTFHVKLGTMAQRIERIVALAKHIAPLLGANVETAGEAARLAKADLASKMVGEFPELQGVMGGYYADALKLPGDVANAIREHYKPQGPSDTVPQGKVSAAVALADKIDTLVGFFAIDEKPTGSKDPYALRRSALGILRIIREHGLRLSLGVLVGAWYNNVAGLPVDPREEGAVKAEILDFFADRLKVQLREEGISLDILDAVMARKDDDIVRMTDKIAVLQRLSGTPQGDDLLAAHKRAANFLASAKVTRLGGEPKALPGAPEVETALLAHLNRLKPAMQAALGHENYHEALLLIAALRHDVDKFLDGVLVNSDNEAERTNRLLLLQGVCDLSKDIADLGKIA